MLANNCWTLAQTSAQCDIDRALLLSPGPWGVYPYQVVGMSLWLQRLTHDATWCLVVDRSGRRCRQGDDACFACSSSPRVLCSRVACVQLAARHNARGPTVCQHARHRATHCRADRADTVTWHSHTRYIFCVCWQNNWFIRTYIFSALRYWSQAIYIML